MVTAFPPAPGPYPQLPSLKPLDPYDRFCPPSAPPPPLPPPPVPGQFSAPPFRGPSAWPPGHTFPDEWRQIQLETAAVFIRGWVGALVIIALLFGGIWLFNR